MKKKKIFVAKIILIILFIFFMSKFLNINFIKNSHFDLITVNSIFSGFLFTSLSILLGFNNEEIIEFLEEGDYLDSVYQNVTKGLIFSIVSIITSILNLTIFESYSYFINVLKYLHSAEMTFLVITIIKFIRAIIDLSFLISNIRTYKKKKIKEDKINRGLNKKFNKK